MKKKKLIMIICILVNLIMLFNFCYAQTDLQIGDLNEYQGNEAQSAKLVSKASVIFGVLQTVGVVLSVVVLVAIGIKYMLGSVEEKADYKKTLLPYIIGALILFTGSLLPQIIYLFSQELNRF